MNTYQISIKPSAVAQILITLTLVLITLSLCGHFAAHTTKHIYAIKLARLFSVNAEMNFPSGFSVLLLLFAALLLAAITTLERNNARPLVWHWGALSLGFLCMAFDEAFSFHETLIRPMRHLLGDKTLGIFYFAWVIPGILLIIIIFLAFIPFLMKLNAQTRSAFVGAAILYVGGAVGFELLGGYCAELHGMQTMTFLALTTVEEGLEMSGVIMFIWALLTYASNTYGEVRFQVGEE